jgi:putative methyltransferase
MRFYIEISKILQEVDKGKSFKNAVYDAVTSESPHFKKTYKIVIEMIKLKSLLDELMTNFFINENITNPNLFRVLLYEYFFSGIKLKIGGSLMKIIKSKKDQIQNYLKNNEDYLNIEAINKEKNSKNPEKPKILREEKLYFRLNKQKNMNSKKIFKKLSEENFNFNKDSFVKGLFYLDKEGKKDLSAFFKLRDESDILIQTKSSSLPAYILRKVYDYKKINKESENKNKKKEEENEEKVFNVIDTCSAPGNKTLQLAEYFPNSNIFAYEKDPKRFQMLNKNVEKNNHFKNIQTFDEDFLLSNPNEDYFNNTEIILSDPSCSGSGTKNNSLENKNLNSCCLEIASSIEEENILPRLESLSQFQYKIVNHCMKFPNVKLISYSTCSVFKTENEDVVESLLKKNPQFKLVDIFDIIKKEAEKDNNNENVEDLFHKGITEKTKFTLRACRKCSGGIDGFYVAIFERIE